MEFTQKNNFFLLNIKYNKTFQQLRTAFFMAPIIMKFDLDQQIIMKFDILNYIKKKVISQYDKTDIHCSVAYFSK